MRALSLGLLATFLVAAADPAPSASPAPALVHAKPALWKVADKDTTIYLFGTIHLLKPETRWFEGKIKTAFDASDELVLEMVEPSPAEAQKIVADAVALADAGAFAIVIEGVVEPIAIEVTKAVACPTIGIGASAQCDGQVLVTEDMLGMFERVPRFVKRYEAIAETISGAAERYAAEVRDRSFPGVEQTYQPK